MIKHMYVIVIIKAMFVCHKRKQMRKRLACHKWVSNPCLKRRLQLERYSNIIATILTQQVNIRALSDAIEAVVLLDG